VSTFSLASALSVLGFALLACCVGTRPSLSLAGALLAASAALMLGIDAPIEGLITACCFGAGIGGVLTVLPLAWADYFGRTSFAAIRGAGSPSGVPAGLGTLAFRAAVRGLRQLRRLASLALFAALALLSVLAALFVRPPGRLLTPIR
jgi:hypothetical protein